MSPGGTPPSMPSSAAKLWIMISSTDGGLFGTAFLSKSMKRSPQPERFTLSSAPRVSQHLAKRRLDFSPIDKIKAAVMASRLCQLRKGKERPYGSRLYN